VYEGNNLEQLDLETEVDCAILGDACYKVIWDSETKSVRITAPDVQGIYAWWLGDDSSQVWRVVSKYTLSAEEAEFLHQVTPKAKMATIIELWTAEEFELYLDNALIEKKPNPYGFIPFVIYPNLREPKKFWGISDLPQIIEPQQELNRAMSQLSRILELSGNPIAVLENVEESQDIAVRPEAVWNIPEDAKAFLLDLLQGGGVRLHIDYINLLYRTLHDISESPRAAFGGAERDLSGVALQIELHPLLQKIKRKRIIRTSAYNRRSEMILKLLEKYQGESFGNNRLRVIWAPVLPQDMARLVSNEQTLIQTGIHSRRRAMEEVGVKDPEYEFNRWLEERKTEEWLTFLPWNFLQFAGISITVSKYCVRWRIFQDTFLYIFVSPLILRNLFPFFIKDHNHIVLKPENSFNHYYLLSKLPHPFQIRYLWN